MVDDLSKKEKLIDQFIKQDDKDSAVKFLFELILVCAKKNNFAKAEHLRERLLEVDPMALDEIIRSGEIIEEAKSELLDQSHRNIWSNLYETLTTEEANALYYAMEDVTCNDNEFVFKQFDQNDNLCFIDQGKLKIVYHQGNRETLIKTLGRGDLAGEDTFFSVSFCTTSLITLSHTKIKLLNKAVLPKWVDGFPDLESKLLNFCNRSERIDALLKKKGKDRRSYKRFKITGKIAIQLLNPSGKLTEKVFKGELSDISVGGLSFYMKIAKGATARLLLGRNLRVKFILPLPEFPEVMDETGVVNGIVYHLFSEYSIHVKFDKIFDQKIAGKIAQFPGS